MPIDEQKLRGILTEQEENLKRHVGVLIEDTKRHVGVLVEETDRKLDLVLEGHQGLSDKMDRLREEVAGIQKEIEEIRLHLFRKADLERLEALEQRVTTLEKRFPGR